ncbi:MAG: flavodoxin domain-containing protein [Smithella sp.]|jgi:menaquinone-dependent protoporphyrinogen IX oxidase
MRKAIIVFDTVSGSTREMAEIIRGELNVLSVDIARVDDVTSLSGYDAVIIGSPMRFGAFTVKIKKFIKKYRNELSLKKVIYYFSSLYIINIKEEEQSATTLYIDPSLNIQTISKRDATPMDKTHSIGYYYQAILKHTAGITPLAIAFFNGRLDLQKLNIFERLFMKIVTSVTTKERIGEFLTPGSVRQGAAIFRSNLV